MSNPQEENQPIPILSISDLANQPQWTGNLVSEDPIDKEHRLRQEAYDACHKRWRMNVIILLAGLGLGFVFYLCLSTLNDSNATASDKKWATAFVSSIVTGSVGFLTGKAVS